VETLSLARRKASALLNEEVISNVMMDPGCENKNSQVFQFITSRNLLRTLAQVDIHYSNLDCGRKAVVETT
jgi:hypothetical protein